ncbi:hypothetical protein I5192_20125 (plasmid) [Ruegeria sp. SCSIO 43209]|uniref:hypothetical protein n=1 Tax=Ruegeria sp. SCSIO 43209 TaxID=2793010 RepID=UPI001CA8946D|nr:hypothetical protein [Ruegeria sp. SCSIO 43209]UAB91544.1 hypothetical protein I5192_20125 [Ruegeria sp. SCSIO 43209]
MPENEETYFRQAVAGARAFKETEETESSLEWIDDLEGIAINGSHEYMIKSLRELDRLAKSENEEISAKAKEALELALELTKV